MESLMHTDEEEMSPATTSGQALSFFMHTALALGSWLALMFLGYALNPQGVPQVVILILSIFVPLIVGHIVMRLRRTKWRRWFGW